MTVRPAKTQISLGIHPVWPESSLSAWRNIGTLATYWVHSKDSDQTGRMPRLIWVVAGCTVILLVLSWGSSNFCEHYYSDTFNLLAHLSRRLTRWAYSIPMVRCPSVVVHTFKLEYLWRQLANLDQIVCVTSLGWGKGCIRFWGRLDQNSGFHGNRKPPLTYNGENDVSTFSRLFLIRSFLYLQVTRTCIKSRTSSAKSDHWLRS